jgi:hypothetical protein
MKKLIKLTLYLLLLAGIITYFFFPDIFLKIWKYIEENELVIAVVGAVLGSYLFLWLVFKPDIKFSRQICLQKNWRPPGDDRVTPKDIYVIKIVNNSFFRAYDAHFELSLMQKFHSTEANKPNKFIRPLALERAHMSYVAPKKFVTNKLPRFLADETAEFAFRIRVNEDLLDLLGRDTCKLRLQITLSHGLSGVKDICVKEYEGSLCIVEGEFEHGYSMNIKK